MKFWRIEVSTPYAGTNQTHYISAETEEIANEIGEDLAYENGESYEYCATGWGNDFEDEEARESYYEECGCSIEEITQDEYEEESGEKYSD